MNPLEHRSLLTALLTAQEPQAVKNLPRIKLVKFSLTIFSFAFVFLVLLFTAVVHLMSQPQLYVFFFSFLISARATLEILIPDFVKQTAEEKPVEGDELEVRLLIVPVFGTKKTKKAEPIFSSSVF